VIKLAIVLLALLVGVAVPSAEAFLFFKSNSFTQYTGKSGTRAPPGKVLATGTNTTNCLATGMDTTSCLATGNN
jgi:hypothetical protein